MLNKKLYLVKCYIVVNVIEKSESEKNIITFRRRYHKKSYHYRFVSNSLGRNFESYNKETEHKKEMII